MPLLNLELDRRRDLAGRTAAPMFWLSLGALVCQAILVVVWVDVAAWNRDATRRGDPARPEVSAFDERPDVGETSAVAEGDAAEVAELLVPPESARPVATAAGWAIVAMWPLFLAEAIFHWMTRPWRRAAGFHFAGLLFCLSPSLRLCARSPEMEGRVWLPSLGWRRPDERLRRQLERLFSVPMMLIALLILPVLLVEFGLSDQVAASPLLRLFVHVGTGVIWFAFAAEFILMISVAEKKWLYAKEHWLDLAIILLPLLSFLRSLQVARVSKLFRTAKIPQVGKLARVYRLRGTAIRLFRSLVVLDVLQRLLARNPANLIERLELRQRQLERESRLLRLQIHRLRRREQEQKQKHELKGQRQGSAGAEPAE